MSPLHHHFELRGWKENTVIVRFDPLGHLRPPRPGDPETEMSIPGKRRGEALGGTAAALLLRSEGGSRSSSSAEENRL
jgi:hypothetical protein